MLRLIVAFDHLRSNDLLRCILVSILNIYNLIICSGSCRDCSVDLNGGEFHVRKRTTACFLKPSKPLPYYDPSRLKNGYESLYFSIVLTLALSMLSRREVTSTVKVALASVSSSARQEAPSSFFTCSNRALTSPLRVHIPSLYFFSWFASLTPQAFDDGFLSGTPNLSAGIFTEA